MNFLSGAGSFFMKKEGSYRSFRLFTDRGPAHIRADRQAGSQAPRRSY